MCLIKSSERLLFKIILQNLYLMLKNERQDETAAYSSTQLRTYLQCADITQMQLLGAVETYFVEYKELGYERHCQIGATNESEARNIFNKHFPYCFIVKMQTVKDIADEISSALIEVVKRQLNCA